MTKTLAFALAPIFLLWAGACTSGKEGGPRLNDFAFYRYEIYQGDSLVYSATKEPEDTAQTFVEDPALHGGNDFQVALMKQLPRLMPGDSARFAVGPGLEGRLYLLHFIRQEDYPRYIEEGDRRRAVFEARLEEIKAEMAEKEPFFKGRAQAVADSALRWGEMLRRGELDGQLQSFKPGIQYLLIHRGEGPLANKSSSWTWIHFCAVSPAGNILLNTYAAKPVVVNRRGALLAPWVERSVIQFPEGSTVLLKVPYELAFGEEGNVPVQAGSDLYVLLEILKSNNM